MKEKAILILNSGSSSLKFAVFQEKSGSTIIHGSVNNIIDSAKLSIRFGSELKEEDIGKSSHAKAIEKVMRFISNNMNYEIIGVGHRVVHGGKMFVSPTVINKNVISQLEELISLAPLHQPYNLEGINSITLHDPSLIQVACFDTSFHITQPKLAREFAIPRKYTQEGVIRYGFHGLSYQYIASVMPNYLKNANGKVIVLHLGNGSSICAMNNLKSVATTMGFTALDGLMMGTRCGSIDPGAILYLLENYKMSVSDLLNILYNESGLKGVSDISHDMTKLLEVTTDEAKEAIELFCYNAAKHLASLIPSIDGIDTIVFTGGIGSNSSVIRSKICSKLSWLGVALDEVKNKENNTEIHKKDSVVGIYVIQTNEEKIIFNETKKLLYS